MFETLTLFGLLALGLLWISRPIKMEVLSETATVYLDRSTGRLVLYGKIEARSRFGIHHLDLTMKQCKQALALGAEYAKIPYFQCLRIDFKAKTVKMIRSA